MDILTGPLNKTLVSHHGILSALITGLLEELPEKSWKTFRLIEQAAQNDRLDTGTLGLWKELKDAYYKDLKKYEDLVGEI